MSASKARPLEATGRRSAAGAPARRTARNQRFEACSNWLKTTFPAYSRTAVGAPGVATVWAGGGAGRGDGLGGRGRGQREDDGGGRDDGDGEVQAGHVLTNSAVRPK